jgi:PST family polysaccharide transporter
MTTDETFTEDIHIEEIKKRSVTGVFSLTIRRVFLQLVGIVGLILLTRILNPIEFGIYAIVSFIVNFFGYFSDVGLAAALIQKKGELTKDDLRSTFTTQMLLVGTLVVLIIILAPLIVHNFYRGKLGEDGIILVQVLAFSLVLASLKSIPSIILERKLQFQKLILPEIAETLIFNTLLVYCAYTGYGVWSFIIAILVRGFVGVILMYIIVPWPIGLSWNRTSLRSLFSFGLPYQLNSLIALVKDNIVPTFVAGFLGPAAVGNITWAQKYAFLPLTIVSDVVRVTFPTYARLQEHPNLLKKAIEKTMYFMGLVIYPALFGLVAIAPWMIKYVFTDKWLPALPLLYLFCITTFWASISTTFTNALFAIGKAKVVLNFMILWTILEWTVTPLCTWLFKDIGVAISSVLISFTSIGVIIVMKRYVQVDIIKTIGIQIAVSIVMAIFVRIFAINAVTNPALFVCDIILGGTVYLFGMYLFDRTRIIAETRKILKYYKK